MIPTPVARCQLPVDCCYTSQLKVATLLSYQLQEFFFSDLDTGNHRAKATVARAANRMTKKKQH